MKKKILSSITTLATVVAMTTISLGYSIDVEVQAPQGSIGSSVSKVLGVAQWIGFIVAVGMLIYVGVKYLTAGAGEKAKVKDTLIPMLVGAILVVLAPTIANAIFTTMQAN